MMGMMAMALAVEEGEDEGRHAKRGQQKVVAAFSEMREVPQWTERERGAAFKTATWSI
jgi:hypothetical protein